MTAYRMHEFSREEMAAADPFGGRGVFLPAPGASSGEMLARITALAGSVPAVAWDGIGAWVDPGSDGMNTAGVVGQWNGGRASGHW